MIKALVCIGIGFVIGVMTAVVIAVALAGKDDL